MLWRTLPQIPLAGCVLASLVLAAPPDPLTISPSPQWSTEKAAHLLRRAGFGGTPEQIRLLAQLGREAAVASLVDYDNIPRDVPDFPVDGMPERPPRGDFARMPEEARKELFRSFSRLTNAYHTAMQDWWLGRMVITPRPLEEKMTLFWHGHFTSGFREVRRPRAMYLQNDFLRRNAMSDFKTLVKGISRDWAMSLYLDGARNVKAHPNENYARELMELFTMGVGNYTEEDVKEAARAFTGWRADENGFTVRRRDHDNGIKTFLGRTGNFDGDDIIDIIFEQPATAEHLARRLWTFFVEPEPPETIVTALAVRIRENNYSIRETMRIILSCDVFYAPRVRFAQIKSPAELMVGSARLLETPLVDARSANIAMRQMGQELFQPPNVKGWDGGRAWINTSTLFIRYNTAAGVVFGTRRPPVDREALQIVRQLRAIGVGREEAVTVAMLPGDMKGDDDEAMAGEAMASPDEMVALDEETRELARAIEQLPPRAREWLRNIEFPPQYSSNQPPYDPRPTLEKYKLETADAVVNHYTRRLLGMDLPTDRRKILVQTLTAGGGRFNPRSDSGLEAIRSLVHLIMSMPEYQLH